MEMENNKLILVYYIAIMHLEPHDIAEYMKRVKDKIHIPDFDGHMIFVPVYTHETKIECINPKYITEEELLTKHTSLMNELNKELQYHVEELRKNRENG